MSVNTSQEELLPVWTASWDIEKSQESVSNAVSELVNPRTITQKHIPEVREQAAQDIRKYRWWRDEGRNDNTKATNELTNIQEEIRILKWEQRAFKKSRWWKFLHMLDQYHIRANQKYEDFNEAIESLELREEAYEEEQSRNQRRIDTYTRLPKETLALLREQSADIPLSVEEKKQLLQPEVLSSLSLDEYILLWKRLHPYFLGHVTRQWFRDHVSGSDHMWGLEEFHEWFTSILDDDKQLLPPISVRKGVNPHDRETIEAYVRNEIIPKSDNAQAAKSDLDAALWASLASAPKYAADTSVHFAKEIIADNTYGWEQWNEVFYVFPSDVLASQYDYAFNWTEDFREKQHEEKWNDIFVWPSDKDTNAIPLDMWIVFLPEDAQVDPDTGSKYAHREVDGAKTMIENEENKSVVREVLETLKNDEIEWIEEKFLSLMHEQGFSLGDRLDISSYWAISNYIGFKNRDDTEYLEDQLKRVMSGIGILWKPAEETISSREYWESYFEKTPDKKPAHVVYYQGDPTQAVHDFLIENGIKERRDVSDVSDDPLLGLWEKHVSSMKEDDRAKPWYDFLIEVAHEVIDAHYEV